MRRKPAKGAKRRLRRAQRLVEAGFAGESIKKDVRDGLLTRTFSMAKVTTLCQDTIHGIVTVRAGLLK
jgi:DNA recombination-dependent growth factor C